MRVTRLEAPYSERRPGIKLTNRYLSATRTQRPKNQESIFDLSLDPSAVERAYPSRAGKCERATNSDASLTTLTCFAVSSTKGKEICIIREVPAGPDKAMKIAVYWILFLGQTIGDATILSHLIPLFRRLVTSGLDEKVAPETLVFAALGVTIIQVCYWLDQHWFATLRLGHNPFLGHVILFLSRLNFIFAAAVFSAVCLVRFNELEISLWGFVWLAAVLFSIFCYTLELERLGRALVEHKDRS
jgi:hypothetical protein